MEAIKSVIGNYKVSQVGYLVKDVQEGIVKFEAFLGKPCDNLNETLVYEESRCTYHGERCDGRAKCAFFDLGDGMAIELIEPDGKPSIWTDDLPAYEGKVHHIAFNIKGMKDKIERCEAAGLKCIQTGEFIGGRYAYIEASDLLGARLELLEYDTKPL